MRIKFKLVSAICIACWFFLAGFPVDGYNSLNGSAETSLPLDIYSSESIEVDLSQGIEQNYSSNMSQNLTDMDMNASDSVDYSRVNCQGQLWIVDYWGNHYPCNAKCVFLNDIAKMIIVPCKTGFLKLFEKYPDRNVVESRNIPVYANKKYSWWFVGDTEGQHELWFTLKDLRGSVSRSDSATFRVIVENCSPIANCSPSS
jgi:hypothetical protein